MIFSANELRWLSRSAFNLYSAKSVPELVEATASAIKERFRLVAFTCEEAGRGISSYVAHAMYLEVALPRDYPVYFHDHPLQESIWADNNLGLLQMRQQVSLSKWRKTDHYNGIAKPVGFTDQIFLVAQVVPTFVGFGMNADAVFSERENRLLRLLQPHVVAAWRRVGSTARRQLNIGDPWIALSPDLRPVILSVTHRLLLRSYFPSWRSMSGLPEEISDWLVDSLRRIHSEHPPTPLLALAKHSMRGRLLIRCFPNRNGLVELLLVETPIAANQTGAEKFQLTEREVEVLRWLVAGKRNSEIALILGIASATASKHVENILRKLGVHSRTEARIGLKRSEAVRSS
jgi:DNA-binding CsgD family transcriptional regulator